MHLSGVQTGSERIVEWAADRRLVRL